MSARQATPPCRSRSHSIPHTSTGYGQGGTRNSRTSRKLQTWSVSPAAMAGVHGLHILAEPGPWVDSGSGKGWRKEACGKQKL
jgi:hypothetical protein